MAQSLAQQRQLRVIAKNTKDANVHRTVNIVAVAPSDPHHSVKAATQITAAQYTPGTHETVQDSGGTVKGLPTVYINGYTAPN